MAGWTNIGKNEILTGYFAASGIPTNFYVALLAACTTTPNACVNLMSDCVEITAGNGYTSGGCQLTRDTTDFDVRTEDDSASNALIQVKDLAWTATGGNLPASGCALYAVLTDDDGTVANRVIYAYWSLTSGRVVSDGQTLTLQDLQLQLNES